MRRLRSGTKTGFIAAHWTSAKPIGASELSPTAPLRALREQTVIGPHLERFTPGRAGCHRHRARRPSRIRRRGQRRRVAQLPAVDRRLSAAGSRPAWRHSGARPGVGRPAYARTRRVATSATAVSVTGASVVSVVVLIISALCDVPLRRQTRSAHGPCGGGPARQEMFRFRRRTAAAPLLPGSAGRTSSGLRSVDGLAPLPLVAPGAVSPCGSLASMARRQRWCSVVRPSV